MKENEEKSSLSKVISYFSKQYLENHPENTVNIDYRDLEGVFRSEGLINVLEDRKLEILAKITDMAEKRIILENMPINYQLKELTSKHIGKVVSFEGVIKSKSEIRPEPYHLTYTCTCMTRQKFRIPQIFIDENPSYPVFCKQCGNKREFKMVKSETEYLDVLNMKVEEPFENRIGGNPRYFQCIVKGDLADPNHNFIPGDKVKVTGIFKEITTERKKTKKRIFVVDVLNLEGIETTYKNIEFTPEDISRIHELADDNYIFEKLRESILPNLIGKSEVKEGILCQLFSVDEEGANKRGRLHVLLAGDPGVSKSQILLRVKELNLKASYTVGGATTEAGLLGATLRDELTGLWNSEPGLLPMCNEGFLAYDELDKTHHTLLGKLNEALEQGQVTITKAGGNMTYPAKTTVLGALNPKKGHFDAYKGVREQIELPDSLLDRFDLLYILQDIPDTKTDRALAWSLGGYGETNEKIISDELLIKYICYAKREIKPILSPEAVNTLEKYYQELRNDLDCKKIITPRDLEALMRITISLARMELSNVADIKHSKKAIKIFNESLESLEIKLRLSNLEKIEMKAYDDIIE